MKDTKVIRPLCESQYDKMMVSGSRLLPRLIKLHKMIAQVQCVRLTKVNHEKRYDTRFVRRIRCSDFVTRINSLLTTRRARFKIRSTPSHNLRPLPRGSDVEFAI